MAIQLIVRHPFADYVTGERITDPAKIREALEHNPHLVIKVSDDAGQTVGETPATA